MSENKKLLVVIDPGHTGNTYNAGAVKGYYESKAVYDLSLYEKTALEKRGIDVILTRERNQDPGLYERGQMAVKKGNGYANVLFESNHTDAFNGKVCGVTVVRSAHLPGSEKLAEKMIDAIVKVMKPSTGITYNRGVVTKTQSNGADWYGVIRGAVSGAASQGQAKNGPVRYDYIVEHGFHDNPKECLFLSKQENLKAIAEAKAAAIAEYFGIGNKSQPANQSGQSSQNNRNNDSHQTDQNTSTDSTILNKKDSISGKSFHWQSEHPAGTHDSFKGCGIYRQGGIYHYRRSNGNCQYSRREKPMGKLKSGQGWISLIMPGKWLEKFEKSF